MIKKILSLDRPLKYVYMTKGKKGRGATEGKLREESNDGFRREVTNWTGGKTGLESEDLGISGERDRRICIRRE